MKRGEGFSLAAYAVFTAVVVAVFVLCVSVGSVSIAPREILGALVAAFGGGDMAQSSAQPIIISVRIPRVICAALIGASLSLCGAVMQGLLRNPLADVSTLGVSSGASLGAVLTIVTGVSLPWLREGGIMGMSILFAFLSLMLILSIASKLDYSFSTNTILLIGIVFSMFAQSLISVLIVFAGEKVRNVVFWTMGSLSGSSYKNAVLLSVALIVCGGVALRFSRELNAFAVGEENARHVGIDVKKVKLILLIAVSVITGLCVAVGGTIAFVGLIIPHISRLITGPNHRKLLPASIFIGAAFLMLADLVARILLNPVELPIGVVTSMVGSLVFVQIFYTTRKAG